MLTSNDSDHFTRDAGHQIAVRGYPVAEASRRLGVGDNVETQFKFIGA